MILSALLAEARASLAEAGIADARLDARLLVEHFSATTQGDVIGSPDMAIDAGAAQAVRQAIARRAAGEPVHRILGFREFYGLKLFLSPDTLEPRPDTETLVDAVLPHLRHLAARAGACRILDLGTGTGAIALALLAEVPEATAVGVDISADALATAQRNAQENGLAERFTPIRSDWFEKISGRFHVIAANPPYIPTEELETLQCEVRKFDPARALDGGADGLDAYRTIAAQAEAHLEPTGRVAVEIGHAQKEAVTRVFETAGFGIVEARKDLGGRDRVMVFTRK
ncbi:peptide chain release factor N(5)-glutamine methyltransferase [Mesorhizobium sp. KR9-304]|uniref:peptide chain release factor N(5)-glutamine methyltransferase n=1 Tax=Mesorhizobium sp. KR9-304 TaxID=3156614 RepID=UPI0032B60A3B